MTDLAEAKGAGFQEFPLLMSHPQFKKSESIPIEGSEIYGRDGVVIRRDFRGTPERFPPVTIKSELEEEYYKAQGYERAGDMDPAAWVRAHTSAPPEDYKPLQYPVWRTVDGKDILVKRPEDDPEVSPEVLEAHRKAEEALKVAAPEDDAPSELDNMRAQMAAMAEQMAKMTAAMAEQNKPRHEAHPEADLSLADDHGADQDADTIKRGPGRPKRVN